MISEQAFNDMVTRVLAAAQRGEPLPDFGYLTNLSQVQRERLNRAYDDTRNYYDARYRRAKR